MTNSSGLGGLLSRRRGRLYIAVAVIGALTSR